MGLLLMWGWTDQQHTQAHIMKDLQDRLKAEKNHGRWSVADLAGGVWHPNDEVQAYLEGSLDPAEVVVRICIQGDHRGKWHA